MKAADEPTKPTEGGGDESPKSSAPRTPVGQRKSQAATTPKLAALRRHQEARAAERAQQQTEKSTDKPQRQPTASGVPAPSHDVYSFSTFQPPTYSTFAPYERRSRSVADSYGFNIPRPESVPPPALDGAELLGLYRPNRQYSYTMLARPDGVESVYGGSVRGADIYGIDSMRPSSRFSTLVDPIKMRSASAMSNAHSEKPPFVVGAYRQPEPDGPTFVKESVNWTTLNVCSYMQIVCGVSIFVIGIVRLILKTDAAMAQDLLYGVSAITAGVFGHFATRQRSYSLAVACFVHSLINAIAIVFFVAALLPSISGYASRNVAYIELNDAHNASHDTSIVLLAFCCVQFAVAAAVAVYGCRTAGAVLRHVEETRFNAARVANENMIL